MANDPVNPQVGERVFDGSEFEYLVDLAPGEIQGKRTAQPGCDDVCKEIVANHPEWGAKAGVTPEDVAELEVLNTRIARIDVFLRPLAKFLEMLHETRYLLEDRRQRIILNVAQSVDRRAKVIPELLAKYQKTREYRSAPAKKGVKTRQQNDAPATEPMPPAEPPPVG